MDILDNYRHEAFAHAVATGSDATSAYISAGYRRNEGTGAAACRLLKRPDVQARVKQLQANIETLRQQSVQRIEHKRVISKAWAIDELFDTVQKCKLADRPDYRSANQAVELICKLNGYVIEKSERVIRKSWADFSNDELRALIEEAQQSLQLAAPVEATYEPVTEPVPDVVDEPDPTAYG